MSRIPGSIEIIDVETRKSQKSGKDYRIAQAIVAKKDGHVEVGKIFLREGMPATPGVFMPTIELGSREGNIVPIIVELRAANITSQPKAA